MEEHERKRRRKRERERGGRALTDRESFHSIICSLHEVVLSHTSIMCLFCLTVLSLVQTLVAEAVNG